MLVFGVDYPHFALTKFLMPRYITTALGISPQVKDLLLVKLGLHNSLSTSSVSSSLLGLNWARSMFSDQVSETLSVEFSMKWSPNISELLCCLLTVKLSITKLLMHHHVISQPIM